MTGDDHHHFFVNIKHACKFTLFMHYKIKYSMKAISYILINIFIEIRFAW